MDKNIRMEDLPVYEVTCEDGNVEGIKMVSLVADPAIEMKGMYFSSNLGKDFSFKQINDKQIIVGPAMVPNKKILRKDENDNYYYVYFTPQTIKKMVDKFLKENNNRSINVDHSSQMVDGFIQASWIVEDSTFDKSRYYGFNLPVGSWFIEAKIEDKNFWMNDVKEDGKFGFSIEGVMSQNLVEMEKVSFDFDGTLSQKSVQDIAKKKIEDGDDVYIITKRPESQNVLDMAEKLGIKKSNVIFTNHEPKWSFIEKLKIDTHYDNVDDEVKQIEEKTDAKVIKVKSNVSYSNIIDDLTEDEFFDIFEDISQYAEDSYNDYPKAATENAKIALRWAEENGWGSCGTPVGKARANQLAKGESITRTTIARMAAFERHRQNSQKELGDGCGRLMWLCWGGDAGVEWAQRKLKQIDNQEFVVNPGPSEDKDKFISRCMKVEVGAGKDESQAYAICISKWSEK
jgi:hypothetical protein